MLKYINSKNRKYFAYTTIADLFIHEQLALPYLRQYGYVRNAFINGPTGYKLQTISGKRVYHDNNVIYELPETLEIPDTGIIFGIIPNIYGGITFINLYEDVNATILLEGSINLTTFGYQIIVSQVGIFGNNTWSSNIIRTSTKQLLWIYLRKIDNFNFLGYVNGINVQMTNDGYQAPGTIYVPTSRRIALEGGIIYFSMFGPNNIINTETQDYLGRLYTKHPELLFKKEYYSKTFLSGGEPPPVSADVWRPHSMGFRQPF